MRKTILFFTAAALLASCKTTDGAGTKSANAASPDHAAEALRPAGDQSLASCAGSWTLILLTKCGEAQAMCGTDLTISEEADRSLAFSGSTGENRYTARIKSEKDGALRTLSFGSTKKGVSEETAEFERLFAALFDGADSYQVGTFGNEGFLSLEIRNGGADMTARFVRNSILPSRWKLAAVNTGNAVESAESGATLTLAEKSPAGIFTGLNYVRSEITLDESRGTIQFSGDGPMTLVAGDADAERAERLLLSNLFRAARYSLTGGTLSLYSGDTLLLVFTREAAPAAK